MLDVQALEDARNIPLDKVGVKGIRYPVTVLDREHGTQNTVATVSLFVSLPHHYKGTHMSRFVEVFNKHYRELQMPTFLAMLQEIRLALDAEKAYAEVSFPYFVTKRAPVSGAESMMDYTCRYIGEVSAEREDFIVGVEAAVQTLCPCSKEISSQGAHNQRGVVHVRVKLGPFFWIEDVIDIIESSASSGLYALIKREDERRITESAFDKPVFVEDLVRDVCVGLDGLNSFPWYSVEAETMESIHNHNAYAYVERGHKELEW